MDPRGTVDSIYKENHNALLHTKYKSSGPCGFGEDFPIVYLWELMTPGAGPFFTLGARFVGFIKRTITHCYIQTVKALDLVVLEKNILFYVFPMMPLGQGPY